MQYHLKGIKFRPQKRKIRDWKLVSTDSLMEEIERDEKLMNIFSHSDPNYVANTIIEQMNKIVNYIAPPRVVTVKDNSGFHEDDETKDLKREADIKLNNAIRDDDLEARKKYRATRNKYMRKTNKF